jgi:hypothetical protein
MITDDTGEVLDDVTILQDQDCLMIHDKFINDCTCTAVPHRFLLWIYFLVVSQD